MRLEIDRGLIRKWAGSLALLISSLLFSVLILEIGFKSLRLADTFGDSTINYVLLHNRNGGAVFHNLEQFVLYDKNSEIETAVYYETYAGWVKEYEYTFRTNNFGLVQTANIGPSKESLLLLGDSFTEGQGDAPWFEKFTRTFSSQSLQVINGGIRGTGFQMWMQLHDHLVSQGIMVQRLAVIFISEDLQREIWSLPKSTQNCIAMWVTCKGTDSYYGMPAFENRFGFLERLKASRPPTSQKENFKAIFPALRYAYNYFRTVWQCLFILEEEKSSYEVISKLISLYGNRVLFIHLPQKEEVLHQTMLRPGIRARGKIEALGGRVFDGFAQCGLTLADYYARDRHPNPSGYSKISECVMRAMNSHVVART